ESGSGRYQIRSGSRRSRASSRRRLRRALSSARARALSPGRASSVGTYRRSPKLTISSPYRPRPSLPLTVSGPGRYSSRPSSASQSAALAGGSRNARACARARPSTSTRAPSRAVRLAPASPSSTTTPRARTWSPARRRGSASAPRVRYRPSALAGSSSSARDWMKTPPRPRAKLPVTTPSTVTSCPSSGLRGPRPWTSAMAWMPGGGGTAAVAGASGAGPDGASQAVSGSSRRAGRNRRMAGGSSVSGRGNDDAARRRRRGTGMAPSLLEVVHHPLHGGDDLLVGQGHVAALGGHQAGFALVALDGMAVQGVHALGDAGGPGGPLQLGRTAGAGAVAGGADVLVDESAVQGAIEGNLAGAGLGRGLGRRRGRRGPGGAGIGFADRADARLGGGRRERVLLRLDPVVQDQGQQDQG